MSHWTNTHGVTNTLYYHSGYVSETITRFFPLAWPLYLSVISSEA